MSFLFQRYLADKRTLMLFLTFRKQHPIQPLQNVIILVIDVGTLRTQTKMKIRSHVSILTKTVASLLILDACLDWIYRPSSPETPEKK